MSIRFGVSPIAWANDDMPELGGDTPLEAILREIARRSASKASNSAASFRASRTR